MSVQLMNFLSQICELIENNSKLSSQLVYLEKKTKNIARHKPNYDKNVSNYELYIMYKRYK